MLMDSVDWKFGGYGLSLPYNGWGLESFRGFSTHVYGTLTGKDHLILLTKPTCGVRRFWIFTACWLRVQRKLPESGLSSEVI